MHSKDLKEFQDRDGYIDITDIMALDINAYGEPYNACSFKTDDGVRVFWKSCLPDSFTHFGEVLSSHIARQFGLRSSKYFFAKYKGVDGTISKDFKQEGEREVLGRDFLIAYYKKTHTDFKYILSHENFNNIEFIQKALQYNIDEGKISKNDANDILQNLLKTIMYDIARLDGDRAHINWGLLFSKGRVRSIPIYDNGRCFSLYNSRRQLRELFGDYIDTPSKRNLIKCQDFLTKENELCTNVLNILPENEDSVGLGKYYLKALEEFKEMFPAYFNEQLKNFYSLNLEKVFNSVKEETGVKVPTLVKTVVLLNYEARYKAVQKHFGQTKEEPMEEDKNLMF